MPRFLLRPHPAISVLNVGEWSLITGRGGGGLQTGGGGGVCEVLHLQKGGQKRF